MSEFAISQQLSDYFAGFHPPQGKTEGGDLLEVIVEAGGTIRLVPKPAVDRAWMILIGR